MKKYYLYRHIREDTNTVFYIGIGLEKRPYETRGRNMFWRKIVSITDYRVDILLETEDYEFLQKKEKEFIKIYGRRDLNKGTLCNLTDGGKGAENVVFSIERKNKIKGFSKMSKRVKNIKTGEVFNNITQAAKSIGVKTNTLQYQLIRKSCKDFAYINEEHFIKKNNCKRMIMDKNTGKIYNSIKDACEELNLKYSTTRFHMSSNPLKTTLEYL